MIKQNYNFDENESECIGGIFKDIAEEMNFDFSDEPIFFTEENEESVFEKMLKDMGMDFEEK